MEVVLEYVLLDNFLIDLMLLVLANKILALPTLKLGVVLASSFGAGFAVISPLIRVGGVLAVIIKLFMGFIITWMSGLSCKKLWLKFLVFVSLIFLFGGAVVAIFSFLGVSVYDSLYLGYVSSLPLGTLLISAFFFACMMFRLVKRVLYRAFVMSNSIELYLELNNRRAKLRSFVDTGNVLHNSAGLPIVVVPFEALDKWFTPKEQIKIYLNKLNTLSLANTEILRVNSMGKSYEMRVFDCIAEISKIKRRVSLGVSMASLDLRGCDCIIGKELAEV